MGTSIEYHLEQAIYQQLWKRERMTKMAGKKRGEVRVNSLEMQFERVNRKSQSYELDERLVEMVNLFPFYVKAVRGVQPTADEIVEKALFDLFNNHGGFREWRDSQQGKTRLGLLSKGVKDGAKNTSDEAALAAQLATV